MRQIHKTNTFLKNGPFLPKKDNPKLTDEDNRVPQEFILKNPSQYILGTRK